MENLEWEKLLKAQEEGVVIGLNGVTGVVDRLDIDELLLKKPDTFNLFLLALRDLQEDPDTTKMMGYFQIAGIHGLPKTFWNDVKVGTKTLDREKQDRYGSGYCAHGTLNFATWHRPYLAMMEQTLFVKMIEIAKSFENSEKYIQAARGFRLPFWDYYRPRNYETTFPGVTIGQDAVTGEFLDIGDANINHGKTKDPMDKAKVETKHFFKNPNGTKGPHGIDLLLSTKYPYDFGLPQIFMLEKVMMRLPPHDKRRLDHNPLRTYWFPNNKEIPDSQWQFMGMDRDEMSRGHTVRHLLFGYKSPFQGTNVRMNHIINKVRANGVTQMLNMISDDSEYTDYFTFATTEDRDHIRRYGSLEAVHNSYHNNLGGSGHMSQVPIAAFDPVFWMHHANIDRYLAIWQAAHPDGWIDPETKKLRKKLEPLAEPLKPFFIGEKAENRFWTSLDAVDTETFGYSYSDVYKDPKKTREAFREKYDWSLPSVEKDPPIDMAPLDLSNAQVYADHPEYIKPSAPLTKAMSSLSHREPSQLAADSAPVAQQTLSTETQGKNERVVPRVPGVKDREWFVDDVVERLALNGPFSIDYFIGLEGGAIGVSPQDYAVAPTLAGSTYIFSAPVEACDNCGQQNEQAHLVTDTTPITPMLIDYIKIKHLASLEPKDVKPFLINRLRWRVQTVNGNVIDPRKLHGLKVSVSSKVSSEPGSAEPPVIENHSDIVEAIVHNASQHAGHLV